MTSSQITALGTHSARVYLDYLASRNKGYERISVIQLQHTNEGNYVLKLSKRPFSVDSIEIEINNVAYYSGQISIIEYDEKLRLLTVRPSLGYEKIFNYIDPDKVFVISDLKFLVKHIESWFSTCPSPIQLPQKSSIIKAPDISCFAKNISQEQTSAINSIFSDPFSYIWGAPGTGKTQYVLANATLAYASMSQRIIIVAPTNNSLEQSLSGIIARLEESKIPLTNVLRLGTPSKKFAEKYPQCCEAKGLQKRLESLLAQEKLLYKKLRMHNFKGSFEALDKKILPLVQSLTECYISKKGVSSQLSACDNNIHITEQLLLNLREEMGKISQRIDNLTAEMDSRLFRIKIFLCPSLLQSAEQDKSLLFSELDAVHKRIASIHSEYEALNIQRSSLLRTLAEISERSFAISDEIKSSAAVSNKLYDIVINISEKNIDSVLASLENLKVEALDILSNELDSTPTESLLEQLEDIEKERAVLLKGSIEQRLKNVCVLAVTADGFISNYRRFCINDNGTVEYSPSHIFLDEAGYCSLIKSLPLFSLDCPVTFLGDHMQLPPVCEMSDEDFLTPALSSAFLWAQSAIAIETLFTKDFSAALQQYQDSLSPDFIHLKKSDLTATYRFGQALCNILNEFVYRNGFHSAVENSRFVFDIVSTSKIFSPKKRENPAEADAIVKWLKHVGPTDYAILSPYSNQVKLIGNMLPKAFEEQRIMTVHASQGREWDTVIISISDTSNKWFTDSNKPYALRLLNTAFSRAKHKLVIVCDDNYWSEHPEQFISSIIRIVNDK